MQKYVYIENVVKSFPTSIYLQISASKQPRTSRSKFGGGSIHLFIRLLNKVYHGLAVESAAATIKNIADASNDKLKFMAICTHMCDAKVPGDYTQVQTIGSAVGMVM